MSLRDSSQVGVLVMDVSSHCWFFTSLCVCLRRQKSTSWPPYRTCWDSVCSPPPSWARSANCSLSFTTSCPGRPSPTSSRYDRETNKIQWLQQHSKWIDCTPLDTEFLTGDFHPLKSCERHWSLLKALCSPLLLTPILVHSLVFFLTWNYVKNGK